MRKIYEKILYLMLVDKFIENYTIRLLLKGVGFNNRNFGGFFPGKEVPKTIF